MLDSSLHSPSLLPLAVTVRFVPPPVVVSENVINAEVCIEIIIGTIAAGQDAAVTVSTTSNTAGTCE